MSAIRKFCILVPLVTLLTVCSTLRGGETPYLPVRGSAWQLALGDGSPAVLVACGGAAGQSLVICGGFGRTICALEPAPLASIITPLVDDNE